MWQNKDRFKGLYKPIGEGEIGLIFGNRVIIRRIFHRKRKVGFYGIFLIS